MKNKFNFKSIILTLTLLSLCVGQMWAVNYNTFSAGDVLFYDFSDVTGNGGTNWHTGKEMMYDASGAGSVKCVIFTSSITMTTDWLIAKTAKGSWAEIKFKNRTNSAHNCIKVNAAGNGYTWTTHTKTVAEYVASGDYIMVYGGELSTWGNNQYKYRFMSANNADNTKGGGHSALSKSINGTSYSFGAALLASGTYYQGHWASGLSCAIAAGSAYVVCGTIASPSSDYYEHKATSSSNSLYRIKKQSSTPTTSLTPTCSSSITEGEKLSFTPGSAGVSVLGNDNSIKYYLKNGSTYTEKTLSDGKIDVSDLEAGDYSIITLLYDGYIYVKASTSNFSVTPAAADYTVTYDVHSSGHGSLAATYTTGGASIGASPATVTSGSGLTFTASPNSYYKVEAWYTNAACNAGRHNAGETTYSVASLSSDLNVYVKFEPITYSITYHLNGGTNHVSNPSSYNYTTSTITLQAPTKTGYTFGGWYDNSSFTGSAVTTIPNHSNGNKEYWAKWTINSYNITYSPASAPTGATYTTTPSSANYNSTVDVVVTPTAANYLIQVTAVDAGSNTVTVTNPSANTYRFTMPASNVTVTVTATTLPVVYVLKTKHANSSLGDGATGFPSTGKIWAWKFSGSNNFYTSPGSFPGSTASSKATAITDDIIGDEWYRFIPDNTSYFDGSTAYHVILTSTNRILDTETTFIENGSSHSAATHTGTIWIVPHGTDANTAYLYTSYPDEIATPYNVTYNAGDHGSINVFGTTITSGNSQTISTTKNRTLTATPASGYEFNRWVTSGSVTVADATSATTTVSATGAGGTVTATYFEAVNSGWYIKGDPAGSDWNVPTSLPLNRVFPGETNVYYRPVTLPANDQYFRFWCSNGGNHQYGAGSNNLAVSKDTKYNLTYDGGNAFKYSAGGTVWFVVDASGATKKCWLQDPEVFYSVNFGYSDGCKTFSAKDGEGNDLVSGNTYVSGTALTFTQTKKDGYTFVGWNTAADGSGSSLGTGSSYTVASLSADVNVYAIYTENKTAITINTDGHGTITTPSPNNSPYSLGVATTQAINATAIDGYHWNTWTTSGTAALVSSASTQSNTVKGNGTDGGTGTVTATFTPNTYTVRFHRNGGAGDVVNQDFTYDVAQNLTANSYTRTGYNFAGWALTTDGAVTYANGAEVSNLTTTNEGTFHLYAKWTPKQCPINFDFDATDPGHGSHASATTSTTATYAAAMPSVTPPTAAQGYAFMGYYDAADGTGTKYYNANGTSARTWNKNTESTTTLYAYYKKAEITEITLNAGAFEPVEAEGEGYVVANPTIAPTPTGTTMICWEMLYDNDNPVPSGHAPEAYTEGDTKPDQVRFSIAGLAAGSYKIRATLHTGSGACGTGTTLSVQEASFTIASDFTVTILYKCGDVTIKSSTTNPGKALEGTSITAPDIIGYTFSKWKAGDGVTIDGADASGEKATATITYTANYNGSLTAIYTKKNVIYFYNTVGWSDVWVYFYTSDKYWANDWGTGAYKGKEFESNKQFWDMHYGQMTQIEGTNIWYFDYTAKGWDGWPNIAFANMNKANSGEDNTSDNDKAFFSNTTSNPIQVIRRGDHKTTLPMFVPLTGQTKQKKNNNKAEYLSDGYWMNYPDNTGYTLKIYSSQDATTPIKTIRFPFSENLTMPLKLNVEFNSAAALYYYTIYREDGTILSADYGMNTNWHSDVRLNNPSTKISIKTTAPGIYTYTLVYKNTPATDYYISVDYPIGKDDYRVWYSDNAKWSQSSAHAAGWYHPSDVIRKNTDAEVTQYDTVSFFVAKGEGITTSMKFQYASAVGEDGKITWADVASGGITLSDFSSVITAGGVYNFIIKQVGTAKPEVEKVEPYTGNYYIRTDNAGNTKWDYFRSRDHQMTYTEFSMSAANTTGEKYSHYFASWCERSTNIKFCIANDYSSCISDTLGQDVGNPYKNTDAGGFLNSDGAGDPLYDRYSANVRFMYNETTNKISRAYVGSATNAERKFLILEGNDVLKGDDNEPISDWDPKHALILVDKQNWIYEHVLKIKPGTRFKLYSNYAQQTVDPDSAQYFRGAYESGAWAEDNSKSVILIGGSGDYQMARVIYDFKTNRLMTAWIPSGSDVSGDMQINADVLVEREHQEPAQYITFENASSQLSGVKTVYGAMKFNRWILNNRQHSEDEDPNHGKTAEQIATHHAPLPVGQQKSIYERSLYFISFPFDVNANEIFGFGHYWDEWYLEYYDGLNRAKNGYWEDSPPNWKYVMPSMLNDFVLKANEGYILGLDLDFMKADNFDFWSNGISTVELFFPSTTTAGTLQQTNCTIPALSAIEGDPYRCTINRGTTEGDRRVKDSYWRCLGVPSFNIYNTSLLDGSGNPITWQPDGNTLPFIYAWNKADNTLTAQSASTFTFLPMHAYLVQNGGEIRWTNVSAKPASPIVARRTNEQPEKKYEWRLALMSDSILIDQTYIKMSNLEQVTDTFDFNQDLIKEFNTYRSDIYTYIGNERVAANSMPLQTEQTTIIPVGVKIKTAGEYTFAMPDGTNGVGITLIDTETGVRTSLGLMDYTVTLTAGSFNQRFFLEISPVSNVATDIESTEYRTQNTDVRKVLIDNKLFIIKDGEVYDARGAKVK